MVFLSEQSSTFPKNLSTMKNGDLTNSAAEVVAYWYQLAMFFQLQVSLL
jgi:hypothetical protein